MVAVYTGGADVDVAGHRRLCDHDVLPGDLTRALGDAGGLLILDPVSFPFEALGRSHRDRPLVVVLTFVDEGDRRALAPALRLLGPGDAVVGGDVEGVVSLDVDATDTAGLIAAACQLAGGDGGAKARRRAEARALGWVIRQEARALRVDSVVDVDSGVRSLGWPPQGIDLVERGSPLVAAVRSTRSVAELRAAGGGGERLIRLVDAPAAIDLEAATLVRSSGGSHPCVVYAVAI